jgi:hypothetical protein
MAARGGGSSYADLRDEVWVWSEVASSGTRAPLPGTCASCTFRCWGRERQSQNMLLDAAEYGRPWTEFLTEGDRPTGGPRDTRRTGSTRFCGREQHRRTTGHQTDDQRQTTDLVFGAVPDLLCACRGA